MEKKEKVLLFTMLAALVVLYVTTERNNKVTEKFFERVDSTMVKADSALAKSQRSIKLTDSITQLIRMENQEMMDDIEYNRKLNNINE